jgi:septal ring factor EnvC (AmiA/AmiB activator)
MKVSKPPRVLSRLDKLRQRLQRELQKLLEKQSHHERELQALGKEIESKRRMLELVEATEKQTAAQRAGTARPRAGWACGEHAGEGFSQACRTPTSPRGPPGAVDRGVTANASGSP